MQAVLSRVHRIVVASDEPTVDLELTNDSLDVSSSVSIPQSPFTVPQKPHMSLIVAISDEIKAEIALAVDRLQFATLLGERKKAVNALQLLVQKLDTLEGKKSSDQVTVEEQELSNAAVPAVLAALVSDPRDTELMEAMLEFFHIIVTRVPVAALLLLEKPPENSVATWGMQTCLTLLQDPSPWIRGPAVALVRALQDAQPSAFDESVLECKEGLRRLLEVVGDRREHIRDAALSVLGQLTGRDKNAQQFLAFEEGFDRLFQIMEAEGLMETGASSASGVFADCLQIINNMVRDNLMTQTLFLEMPYLESHVPRILRLAEADGGDEEEDTVALERRKRVLNLGLQLVRFLVTGLYDGAKESSLDEMAQRDRTRKSQELARIQSLVARQEALMGAVGELVCCRSDALADLRLQALDLLRLVSEHNGGVQMILVNLYASPSGRNVLAELVHLDVSIENAESPVAAAASDFLDVLFHENEGACMSVLQHIQTPPPPPPTSFGEDRGSGYKSSSASSSAGRVLLDAFIVNTDFIIQYSENNDAETLNSKLIMAWKASHRLKKLLMNSSYCKELALRVPAEYDESQARPVAGGLFLSRCIRMLRTTVGKELSTAVQSIVFQAKLSVLLLLISWCHDCPKAVREITGSVANLSVLVDILSAKQTSTVSRRVIETTQLRGLIALLLGCCLEFLCEDEEEQALKIATSAVSAAAPKVKPGLEMTRDQLLQMISTRVGLERFTDALVQIQQTPAMLACARASMTQSSRVLLAYRAAYDITDTDTANDDDEAHYLFMLYERAFTIFYRQMAEQIQKRVIAIYSGVNDVSTGVDSGAPNGMGPYQDLIRMQDKQICDLQRQVEVLKQCTMDQESQDKETPATSPHADKALTEQLVAQRELFEREKADTENKIKSMTKSALETETRLNGLTKAYEQLEAEHKQREEELAVFRLRPEVQSSSVQLNSLKAQLATSQADLDAQREVSRRLHSEIAGFKDAASTHVLRERSEGELACARLTKQLEEYCVESERKDEELAECKQMLEMLTEGLALTKNDNERLKAQLAEALSKSGQIDEAEYQGVVDAKAHLENRVEELEAAARAAYKKDQELLRQRIEEVEQARRASLPALLKDAPLTNEVLSTEAPSNEKPWGVNTVDRRLNEHGSTEHGELKELRALVVEMEVVAKEHEAQAKQASFLQDLVAGYEIQSRRDKEKYDATLREVKDELASVFLEKKDAKAAVKELENVVASLSLAKVELEKKLESCHTKEGANKGENGKLFGANGSSRRPTEFENSNDSTVDDLLVLVASLEIQCSVLRDSLKEAQGEDAVAVAIELSRQRGAIVSV
ncbi:hypothetical protein DD238_005480 [Peronospora effusa]|uniref:Vesicle tethering protein Uso1/P115-like head domain-containing protein n=1 Tax=Peronospora effusa TaxID=542832 RepID=A0A3M6VKY2_9STRA|nr:hypothetical protein DD238_005480 [Peronospora effusa]